MPDSILQKMIKPVPSAPEFDPAADGLAGVLSKAASVAGLSELEVQLEAQSRAARQCEPEDFVQNLFESGLYFCIKCDTEGQIGLLALDPALINTILDVLTGELIKGAEMPARPPTQIDAALCQPFIEAILAEFATILAELRGGKRTDIYRISKVEKEPSPHSFPEIPYLEIGIDFDFMNGAGFGKLAVMIPAIHTDYTSTQPRQGEQNAAWQDEFKARVEAAKASFDVVLYRKKMPIGQILHLKSGDILEIPARALENLSIESRKGPHSRRLMKARLGEYQEMRAAKITQIGEEAPSADETPLLEANT